VASGLMIDSVRVTAMQVFLCSVPGHACSRAS